MDQAVSPLGIIDKPKGETIFCPGCGEELEVPKPVVNSVEYHPPKGYYGTYHAYVEVHFQEDVTIQHKCPDPTRDKIATVPDTMQPAGRFRLWN